MYGSHPFLHLGLHRVVCSKNGESIEKENGQCNGNCEYMGVCRDLGKPRILFRRYSKDDKMLRSILLSLIFLGGGSKLRPP